MATMKECKKCGKVKEYTEFSKKTKSKDGYQDRCKACNKVDNDYFRFELNPEHHANWQKKNKKRAAELVAKYRRGDKIGTVYAIISPEKYVYIGQTKTYLQVRMLEHKAKFKKALKTGVSKHRLLHDSFKKHGFENHQVRVLFEDENISRKQLQMIESAFIKSFKEINKSLNKLN